MYHVEKQLEEQIDDWKKSGIGVDGLFLNAELTDAGFDSKYFRAICFKYGIELNATVNRWNTTDLTAEEYYFDKQMYEERYVIGRTNA